MIIERSFPLVKLAAAAGAVVAGVLLAKMLKASRRSVKPKPTLAPAAQVRPSCEVPWGVEAD